MSANTSTSSASDSSLLCGVLRLPDGTSAAELTGDAPGPAEALRCLFAAAARAPALARVARVAAALAALVGAGVTLPAEPAILGF